MTSETCRCLLQQERSQSETQWKSVPPYAPPIAKSEQARKSAAQRQGTAVVYRTPGLRRNRWFSVSSSGRRSQHCEPRPVWARRLEFVVPLGKQRGAGRLGRAPSEITRHCQARRSRPRSTVLPNPSLKRSANGRPPGPVWRYAVHFRQPGPGVLPSSPA